MPIAKIAAADFIAEFEKFGAAEVGRKHNIDVSNVYQRRRRLEQELGRQIKSPNDAPSNVRHAARNPARLHAAVQDGYVIIGSDAHYWPNLISTAHKALCYFARELQPKIVVLNGDVFDGAKASRHAPIGWEHRPEIVDELEAVKERLLEIERAAPNAKRYWPLGNHDARFETRLAQVAPEFARVHGFSLKDHMPYWHPCWSLFLNDESVVIKHRIKGGEHAPFNNTKGAGITTVTGHLHSAKVYPWTDYTGTRWGVDCGTMAATFGPQFEAYMEDSPRNWREAFVILKFWKGRLLTPQHVNVIGDDLVEYCNEIYEVGDAPKKARKR